MGLSSSFTRAVGTATRFTGIAAVFALTVFALTVFAGPFPAFASNGTAGGTAGDVYQPSSSGREVLSSPNYAIAFRSPGSATTVVLPGDDPTDTTAYGEARRAVPVQPILELALGVLVIVGTLVFVSLRKSRRRPK